MSVPAEPFTDPVDLVIHGGRIVNSDGTRSATVVVEGGRITALLDPSIPLPPHERAIDAGGKLVIPGGVDPHCHIGQRLGAYTALDDYEQASVAALWGGTTTVIDFAIPDEPGFSPLQMVRDKLKLAEISRCDTNLHGCVVEWNENAPAEIEQMIALGVRTIKLFTTYEDVVMAGQKVLLEVMRTLRDANGLAYVHAEGNHIIRDAQHAAADGGTLGAAGHPGTRPEIAEAAAVADVLATAEYLGAPVYFVHQTTPEAVDLVRAARRRGVHAYTETCPHYLALDESVYAGEHPERFVCSPPMRALPTVQGLRERALAGDIDALGSDHCCYSTEQKLDRMDDVTEMPNGLPGVETRLPVTYTQLVTELGLPVERFVAMFSTNPARLNGLTNKGAIRVGADADLVVFDPEETRIARTAELHMATDYTPYEGKELHGWPQFVVSGGRVVVDGDGFHDPGPVGRRLESAPIPAQLLT